MKNDLTTGAWQHNIGCPISITLLSTSDAATMVATAIATITATATPTANTTATATATATHPMEEASRKMKIMR
jgi:hypothetical protein